MFEYTPVTEASPGCAVAGPGWAGLVGTMDRPELAAKIQAITGEDGVAVDDLLAVINEEAHPVSFAVVEIVEPTNAIARISLAGDVQVDLGGTTTTRFSWPRVGRWMTGEVAGVESVRISLTGRPDAPPSVAISRGAQPAAYVTVDLGTRHIEYGAAGDDDAAPQPALGVATPAAQPATTSSAKRAASPDAPVTLAEEPSAASAAEAQPADVPAVAERAGRVDRRPRPVDLAQVLAPPTWTLLLPDGNEVPAAARIVVGRKPWRTDPDSTSTYYVLAPSPRREISGKHLEFSVVGDELHATDLASTNGTVVLSGDEPPRLLHHSSIVALHEGDTLDLGEGFRIVIGGRAQTWGNASG